MSTKLSSYRVSANMDASGYVAGMGQKVAADKAGAASAGRVGAAIKATETKVSQAGDVLTRLSRSYVDGFSASERFTRAVSSLGRGIETGNVPMARADAILEGIYRKFGMTANAADLLENGHYQLANAVTVLNNRLATEDTALDLNSAAHRRNAAARTNLVFQLQDIGVSLAGGMNPLMVMMQQGSQISMIYGQEEGGLGRAFSETGKMAGGLVMRLWPVAAVVGVLTAGFRAMTTEINRNGAAQVSIGDVMLATWELASEGVMDTLAPIGKWFMDLWDLIAPYLSQAMNFLIGAFDIAFRNIGTIWSMLPAAMGDVAIQAANGVIQSTQNMINGALGLLNDFIVEANKLLPEGFKMGTVGTVEFKPVDNPYKGSDQALADQMRQNAEEVRAKSMSGAYVALIGARAREIAGRPTDEEAKAAAKEADRQRKAYDDLTRSAQQRIAQAQIEIATLGMSREMAERYRITQELLNKAANDNIDLTPKQTDALRLLASQTAEAEERMRQLKESYDFGKDTFRSFFSDLKGDLMAGTSLWDGFANAGAKALDSIADRALGMAVDGIFDVIFGAVMGGLTGGATGGSWGNGLWGSAIFSAKGNVFDNSAGLHRYANQVVDRPTVFPFAKGGTFGVMGEAGAEAVMPLRRGADGKLGVAANANGMTLKVENINMTGKALRVDSRVESRGGEKVLRNLIRDEVRESTRRAAL